MLLFALSLLLGADRVCSLPPYSFPGDKGKAAVIGPSGNCTWRFAGAASVNVMDYGADNTCTTDVSSIVNTLITSFSAPNVSTGGEIILPAGCYRLSSTVRIGRNVYIHGVGGGMTRGGTVIKPDNGVTAFEVDGPYNSPDGGAGDESFLSTFDIEYAPGQIAGWQSGHLYATGALVYSVANVNYARVFKATAGGTSAGSEPAWSSLAEAATIADGGVTWTAIVAAGVRLAARAHVERVLVYGAPGNAVHIEANTGATGPTGTPRANTNANGFHLSDLQLFGGYSNGLYVSGSDANAGYAEAIDFESNRLWGLYENSFLGNTHIAHEAAANGVGAYALLGVVAYNKLDNCYAEGGNVTKCVGNSLIDGGIAPSGITSDSTCVVSRSHDVQNNVIFHGDPTAPAAPIDFRTRPYVDAAFAWGSTGNRYYAMVPQSPRTDQDSFKFNDADAYIPIAFTNDLHARGAGYSFFQTGMLFQNQRDYNRSRLDFLNSAPVSGTWYASDIVLNSLPTGAASPYGWRNITGGSPGTWVAMRPCDVTGCDITGDLTVDGSLHVNGSFLFFDQTTNIIRLSPTSNQALMIENSGGSPYTTWNTSAGTVTFSVPTTMSSTLTCSAGETIAGTLQANGPIVAASGLTVSTGQTTLNTQTNVNAALELNGSTFINGGALNWRGTNGQDLVTFPTGETQALVYEDTAGALYQVFNSSSPGVSFLQPVTAVSGLTVATGDLTVSTGALNVNGNFLVFGNTTNIIKFPNTTHQALMFENGSGSVLLQFDTFSSTTTFGGQQVVVQDGLALNTAGTFTTASANASTFNGTVTTNNTLTCTDGVTIATGGLAFTNATSANNYATFPTGETEAFWFKNAEGDKVLGFYENNDAVVSGSPRLPSGAIYPYSGLMINGVIYAVGHSDFNNGIAVDPANVGFSHAWRLYDFNGNSFIYVDSISSDHEPGLHFGSNPTFDANLNFDGNGGSNAVGFIYHNDLTAWQMTSAGYLNEYQGRYLMQSTATDNEVVFQNATTKNHVVFPTGEATALDFKDAGGTQYMSINTSTAGVTVPQPMSVGGVLTTTNGEIDLRGATLNLIDLPTGQAQGLVINDQSGTTYLTIDTNAKNLTYGQISAFSSTVYFNGGATIWTAGNGNNIAVVPNALSSALIFEDYNSVHLLVLDTSTAAPRVEFDVPTYYTPTTVAATGSTQSNAKVIAANTVAVTVTAADGTKAVALPCGSSKTAVRVMSQVVGSNLVVFPCNGESDTINGGSANASYSQLGGTSLNYQTADGTNWYTY